ncbi:MAG: hypothetical protein OXU67_12810, partial [Chloroflexota bacterium]|nr:hypothetical protein [Chloroflexota bacterium]
MKYAGSGVVGTRLPFRLPASEQLSEALVFQAGGITLRLGRPAGSLFRQPAGLLNGNTRFGRLALRPFPR